ncbi:MAG: hypothetical protein ACO3UM_11495, partial [Planctomycetota bacterium]
NVRATTESAREAVDRLFAQRADLSVPGIQHRITRQAQTTLVVSRAESRAALGHPDETIEHAHRPRGAMSAGSGARLRGRLAIIRA